MYEHVCEGCFREHTPCCPSCSCYEPAGPEDDDWTTEDHLTFREHASGKVMLRIGADADMWDALRAEMNKRSFWPNIWFISDHGNAHLMTAPKRQRERWPGSIS